MRTTLRGIQQEAAHERRPGPQAAGYRSAGSKALGNGGGGFVPIVGRAEELIELLRWIDQSVISEGCDRFQSAEVRATGLREAWMVNCRSQPTNCAFVFPILWDIYKIPRRDTASPSKSVCSTS